MSRHKPVLCEKLIGRDNGVAKWKCRKCKLIFECGVYSDEIMYCSGIKSGGF